MFCLHAPIVKHGIARSKKPQREITGWGFFNVSEKQNSGQTTAAITLLSTLARSANMNVRTLISGICRGIVKTVWNGNP
uniref:Uncharacterized protein n=1 Tax=Candidatus Kentrum sp. TC TaxID=2126339 RepID=A0A450ZY92_9GAMM|nr:MAG: hypothetical protein BECKTC1821F_GA0114240_10267 [Candidatus Kentron sp. TC]